MKQSEGSERRALPIPRPCRSMQSGRGRMKSGKTKLQVDVVEVCLASPRLHIANVMSTKDNTTDHRPIILTFSSASFLCSSRFPRGSGDLRPRNGGFNTRGIQRVLTVAPSSASSLCQSLPPSCRLDSPTFFPSQPSGPTPFQTSQANCSVISPLTSGTPTPKRSGRT